MSEYTGLPDADKFINGPSQVLENSIKDPYYSPYCMRCPGLTRMRLTSERFYWTCPCGAKADERDNFKALQQAGYPMQVVPMPDTQGALGGHTGHGVLRPMRRPTWP